MITKGIMIKSRDGIKYGEDDELLLERVARIIMTNPLERVNNPLFGSFVETYLFQLPNVLKQYIESEIIKNKVEFYEPRVLVNRVDIKINKDIADIYVYMVKRENFQPLVLEAAIGI